MSLLEKIAFYFVEKPRSYCVLIILIATVICAVSSALYTLTIDDHGVIKGKNTVAHVHLWYIKNELRDNIDSAEMFAKDWATCKATHDFVKLFQEKGELHTDYVKDYVSRLDVNNIAFVGFVTDKGKIIYKTPDGYIEKLNLTIFKAGNTKGFVLIDGNVFALASCDIDKLGVRVVVGKNLQLKAPSEIEKLSIVLWVNDDEKVFQFSEQDKTISITKIDENGKSVGYLILDDIYGKRIVKLKIISDIDLTNGTKRLIVINVLLFVTLFLIVLVAMQTVRKIQIPWVKGS